MKHFAYFVNLFFFYYAPQLAVFGLRCSGEANYSKACARCARGAPINNEIIPTG